MDDAKSSAYISCRFSADFLQLDALLRRSIRVLGPPHLAAAAARGQNPHLAASQSIEGVSRSRFASELT